MDTGNLQNEASLSEGHSDTTSASASPTQATTEATRNQKLTIIGIVIGVLILIALAVGALVFLAQPTTNTEKIRDVFIIFLSLEFLLIGLALVILIIQLATLTNLLRNEIKPILDSTNETARTLRGTAVFLSENLTEPVIQLNSYIAALRRMITLLGLVRKK